MEDLIIWFIIISIGIFVYALITSPIEEFQNLYENDDHDTIYAVSEKHDYTYCLYNAKTNAFLVQVKTLEDIQEFINRFSRKTFMIIKGDLPNE